MPTQSQQPDNLHTSVIDRFSRIATTPNGERKFPVGPESAKKLSYDASEIDSLPLNLTESFCGVGNPFSLGEPEPGQFVFDLGCGAGIDALVAAKKVGPSGRVIGIDMTPEMIATASHNASLLGESNVMFLVGKIESLPVGGASVDLVISNGVLNLCPDKPRVSGQIHRVLKPGGRLQMADIILDPHVTPEEVAIKGSWSD